jgi:hypothetical protein
MPTTGQQTSEHKLSTLAIVLCAIGAGLMAIVATPIGLPAAIVVAASTLGIGATAAGYAVSRGLAKQAAVSETPPAK